MENSSITGTNSKINKSKSSIFMASHKRAHSTSGSMLFSLFSSNSLLQNQNSSECGFNSTVEPSSNASPGNLEITQKEKRQHSVIERLNQEVSILSSQLNQSNLAVSYSTAKLQKNNEKIKSLLEVIEAQKSQLHSLETENISLKQQIELLDMSKENDKKRLEFELESQKMNLDQKVQELIHENKKEKISIENHYIDLITNLNHKFIEEVEYINKKFKEKIRKIKAIERETGECYEKDSELSTFFMPEGQSLIKNSANSSPTPIAYLKKSVDSEELDLSLRTLYGQMNEKQKHKPKDSNDAAKRILSICIKYASNSLKESFLLWADADSKLKIKSFEDLMESVSFNSKCKFFRSLVVVEHALTIRKKMIQKGFFRKWARNTAVFIVQKEIIGKVLNFFNILVSKLKSREYWGWNSIYETASNFIGKKRIIKKYLDYWIEFRYLRDQYVSEGFYKWRSLNSVFKLKKMKVFFEGHKSDD